VHALRDQQPVRCGVEDLRSRHAWGFAVAVLTLANPGLTAVCAEQDCSRASGADIYRE
jgi:hypothetical protein